MESSRFFAFSKTVSKRNSSQIYKNNHFHNHYEIYFFLNGDVDYVVGDAIYSLQPFDLLLIKPTVYHHPNVLSEKPYERSVINFSANFVDKSLLKTLNQEQVLFRFADNKIVQNLFVALNDFKNKAKESDFNFFLKQITNSLILQLKYSQPEQKKEIIHPSLSKILNYVDEHLDEKLDAKSIAKKFFVSPSWISYIFKKHFLISYAEYVNQKKILYAQRLIREGVPIKQVFQLCGFSEYTTFYRQYKRQLKTSPQSDKPIINV